MPSTRRSTRNKGPRTVYTEDPFFLADLSDEPTTERETAETKRKGNRKGKRRKRDDSASDDEFVADSDAEIDKDENKNISDQEAWDLGGEGEDDYVTEVDGSRATPKKRVKSLQRVIKERNPDGLSVVAADETHSRGMLDPKEHASKFMHYIMAFGSDDRDLSAAIHSRGRWSWGRDSTFPTRYSLNQSHGESDVEYGPNLGVHPDDAEKERTVGWDWYYDKDIGSRFRKKQHVNRAIKEADARRLYFPPPRKRSHTILMGPAGNQQAFQLGHHESMDISAAWGDKTGRRSDNSTTSKLREGWIVAFGRKIQCIAWVPNQDSLSQYLAVVTPVTDKQKEKYNRPGIDPVSSFQPAPSYPSALQLWEFRAKVSRGGCTNSLDMAFKPHLRLAMCSEWGDLRRLSWCPMSRAEREEDKRDGTISLGLLAGIWGDGNVRVLDVKLRHGSRITEYVEVTSPVFEAKPPLAVCTCVTWLSPSDIAVGCSNGFVAIWSILPSSAPEPFLYHPIHSTYVLNITSAYPNNPHLISTISMDGETRLWSIIDPQSENTTTVRMRSASSHLSYSPVLQAVCSNDENDYGRLMPIRRFFTTNTIGRTPSSVSALAPCSAWHPSIMYGGAGGEVVATNPLRRLIHSKEQQWQQFWFTHDWVPGPETDSPGISRFYEGYRAESQNLARNLAGEPRPMGLSFTTIHDEGTHVTGLGWNPNRAFAGWGCAALGCGLLRVEDLAT